MQSLKFQNIFILSLIKKFHLDDFWGYAQKFYKLDSQNLNVEDTAQKMGAQDSEIQWIKDHQDYQKSIEKELRNPICATIQKGKVAYQTISDSEIDYVPMLKE